MILRLLIALWLLFSGADAWAQGVGVSQWSSSSVTRVGNTTTYTAYTAWCAVATPGPCTSVFSWPVCSTNGGRFLITSVNVQSSNNPTTKLTGVLWLFSASPSAVFYDDQAFAETNATDKGNLLMQQGIAVSLGNSTGSTSTTFSGEDIEGTTNGPFQCGSSTQTIYGMFEVTNAYVPASGEVLKIWLGTVTIQ
jgi:hypothetical protein